MFYVIYIIMSHYVFSVRTAEQRIYLCIHNLGMLEKCSSSLILCYITLYNYYTCIKVNERFLRFRNSGL